MGEFGANMGKVKNLDEFYSNFCSHSFLLQASIFQTDLLGKVNVDLSVLGLLLSSN